MKTRTATASRARTHGRDDRSPRNHRRDWHGDGSLEETCSFCGSSKPRASMMATSDGPYCRQCWMDHWA